MHMAAFPWRGCAQVPLSQPVPMLVHFLCQTDHLYHPASLTDNSLENHRTVLDQDTDMDTIHPPYSDTPSFTCACVCVYVLSCIQLLTFVALCTHQHIQGTEQFAHHRKSLVLLFYNHTCHPLSPPAHHPLICSPFQKC